MRSPTDATDSSGGTREQRPVIVLREQVVTLRPPDVVLMDIAMPGVDGIAAARTIRAANPAVRVVVVTNYDETDLGHAAQHAGAGAYVMKEELFEVRRILRSLSDT